MDTLPGRGRRDGGHGRISKGEPGTIQTHGPNNRQTDRLTDTYTSRLTWWFCMETLPGRGRRDGGHGRISKGDPGTL